MIEVSVLVAGFGSVQEVLPNSTSMPVVGRDVPTMDKSKPVRVKDEMSAEVVTYS